MASKRILKICILVAFALFIAVLTVLTGFAAPNPQPGTGQRNAKSSAATASANRARIPDNYGQLPLSFEVNQGVKGSLGVSPSMPCATRLTQIVFSNKKANFVAKYRGSTRLASDHDFLLNKCSDSKLAVHAFDDRSSAFDQGHGLLKKSLSTTHGVGTLYNPMWPGRIGREPDRTG
jgi:hypothetical protein